MPVTINPDLRNRIVDQARALAVERGWSFNEPIDVTSGTEDGEPVWIVTSNYMSLGRNVKIALRQADHSLKRAGYLPR